MVALLLPVREVVLGSRIVDSQYLIILASMVLWGISMGSTPVRAQLSVCGMPELRFRPRLSPGPSFEARAAVGPGLWRGAGLGLRKRIVQEQGQSQDPGKGQGQAQGVCFQGGGLQGSVSW